ncbi:MAG: hypothetical protein ACLPKE_25630 [Streptosporangiaceae bacterium]
MSTLTRATAYTARIAALTAATPLMAGAAASAATAKLVGWELRQLANSPLSAEGRQLRAELHTLAAVGRAHANPPEGQEEHAGNGRDRHGRNGTLAAVRP